MKLRPFKKDGGGYGNLDMANQHESDKETPIRHGREGEDEKSETYIGLPARNGKNMTLNKIQHTKVGDDIHFFVNGQENRGVVVKMGGTYVSVFKEDGNIHDIPINETFFVKDILVNKTWDDMSGEERTELLQNARAYSPRFLNKNWDDLPRELKTVLSEKATGMEVNHDKDNLEVEDANHAQTGYAQTQQNTLGKQAPELQASNLPKGQDRYSEGMNESNMQTMGEQAQDERFRGNRSNELDPPTTSETAGDILDTDVNRKTGGLLANLADAKVRGDAKNLEADWKEENDKPASSAIKSIDNTLKTILELKSDVEEGKYGNVGNTAEVGVSTDTPLDVSEESGYEERPHISLEEVGQLPRADAKEHHANEVKETGKKQKIEPHEVKQDKKKGEGGQTGAINTSEGGAFNPVYNAYDTPITPEETKTGRKISGRDQIKKGVPIYNVNSWGIRYVSKGDDPVVESLRTGLHGKYMLGDRHIGDIKHLDPKTWRAHVTLHNMPDMGEYGLLDEEAHVVTEDGKTHKDPRKLTSGGKFSATAMQQERGEGTAGEPDAAPSPKVTPPHPDKGRKDSDLN